MKIYEFRVKLKDYSPSIWRRFRIQSDATLTTLGYVILSSYKANASHLIQFYDKGFSRNFGPAIIYAFPSSDSFENEVDIRDYKINDVFKSVGDVLIFNYDFGDDWEFEITLKKIIDKAADDMKLPVILTGKGYGIIDDCGGAWGLSRIAHAFKMGEGEEYEMFSEWLGSDEIDLSTFDVEEANEDLEAELLELKTAYEGMYEYF